MPSVDEFLSHFSVEFYVYNISSCLFFVCYSRPMQFFLLSFMQLATIGPYPCFWLILFVMSNFSFFTLYSWIFFTIHAFLFMFPVIFFRICASFSHLMSFSSWSVPIFFMIPICFLHVSVSSLACVMLFLPFLRGDVFFVLYVWFHNFLCLMYVLLHKLCVFSSCLCLFSS